ncbi:MAG: hypothetical protein R3E98_17635 [Gemmatimonadota bacterium]
MPTHLLMTFVAVLFGVAGVALTFLPAELAQWAAGASPGPGGLLVLQVMGALYFAFAMVAWTARGSVLGGIYGRAVTIGNLTYALVAGLALARAAPAGSLVVWAAAALHLLLALVFGRMLLTHPARATPQARSSD